MVSVVVVGGSRGIGYGFVQHFAKDPNNIVVATARNKGPTEEKVAAEGLKNVTVVEADMTSSKSLKAAASEVAKLTGGTLDYLINNGAYLEGQTLHRFVDEFDNDPEVLDEDLDKSYNTNVKGVIYATNAFLPLIKKGSVKKVITITSGMGDPDFSTEYGCWEAMAYGISKAAVNMAMAKYDGRYRKEGILFLSINPGFVQTDASSTIPADSELPKKLMAYAEDKKVDFKLLSVSESVGLMMNVIGKATPTNGMGGAFISQNGNKIWL